MAFWDVWRKFHIHILRNLGFFTKLCFRYFIHATKQPFKVILMKTGVFWHFEHRGMVLLPRTWTTFFLPVKTWHYFSLHLVLQINWSKSDIEKILWSIFFEWGEGLSKNSNENVGSREIKWWIVQQDAYGIEKYLKCNMKYESCESSVELSELCKLGRFVRGDLSYECLV